MKYLIFSWVLICLANSVQAQTDYRSAVTTGNWNTLSTWQVRDGSGNWATPATIPSSSSNVYIQRGHNITVDVAANCNDLHLDINGILGIGLNTVSISGKIRAYTATVSTVGSGDGTFYTDNLSTSAIASTMVTSSTTGGLRFVGGTRNINLSTEWNSNSTGNVSLIFALDAGATGTLGAGFKSKTVIVQSGTVSSTGFMSVGPIGTGKSMVIKNGAKFISTRNSTTGPTAPSIGTTSSTGVKCDTIVLENGASIEFTYTNPTIDCSYFSNNGTVIFSGNAQTLLQPSTNGGVVTNNLLAYKNVKLGGGGLKSIPTGLNILISDTLTLEGTSASILGSVSGSSLTYGANASLVFNISTGTTTLAASSIEWPLTNAPNYIEFRRNTVQFTASIPGNSRAIAGAVSFTGGTFNINTGDTLYMSNNSSLSRKAQLGGLAVAGTYVVGATSSDQMNVIVDAAGISVTENKEIQPTIANGKMNLTVTSGTIYSLAAGSRTIADIINNGQIILPSSSTPSFTINGNISGTGTLKGNTSVSLIISGSNTGSVGTISMLTGSESLGSFTMNRANATVTFGTNVSMASSTALNLTAGTISDGGNVITLLGSITGTGTHQTVGIGKIVMQIVSNKTISSVNLGRLEIIASVGINANANNAVVNIAKDLILTSGNLSTNSSSSIIVAGNVSGTTGVQTGNGRIKMTGNNNTIGNVTLTSLEIASTGTITAVSDFNLNSTLSTGGLFLTSGIFNDGGYIITITEGTITGLISSNSGAHISTSNGKIKMTNIANRNLSGVGLSFGNLEIASGTTANINILNSISVKNLILTSGKITDNGNVITVLNDLTGTAGVHTGAGEIKMTGSNNTVFGVQLDSLEIASGANINAASNITLNKGLLLSGNLNDGGFVISVAGSISGGGNHVGTGRIAMIGSLKSIAGETRLNNLEIATGASISSDPPATGCAAFISGTLIMNGGNLGIDTGNTLTMKNGSRIIRNSGNLNLNGGTMAMGENSNDIITIDINSTLLSSNELPGNPTGKIDLTLGDGIVYTLRSNNKSVRNLTLNSGQLNSDPTDLPLVYGITCTGMATINGDYALNAGLNISGTLKFADGLSNKILTTGDKLVFKSSASGDGILAPVLNGNNITGTATVERYLQNKKAWRFLYSPTKHDAQTIQESWMEGGSNNNNPNPGYGIQLSGPLSGAGYDTVVGSYTLKTFNPQANVWEGVTSTLQNFTQQKGYMVFVRGNRSVTSVSQASTPTVVRERGSLNVGEITWNNLGTDAGQFVAIGNPYPSPISLVNVATQNLDNAYYLWDPVGIGASVFGRYQTITFTGGIPTVVPGGGSYLSHSSVQSGQAFFVRTNGAPGQITFHESDKITAHNLVSRNVNSAAWKGIRVNLFKKIDSQYELTDGVLTIFDESNETNTRLRNVSKLMNPTDNIMIKDSNQAISIQHTRVPAPNDSIYYSLSQVSSGEYYLEIIPENIAGIITGVYLYDRQKDTVYSMALNESSRIDLIIQNNDYSSWSDRFVLFFNHASTLPLKFIREYAVRKKEKIELAWEMSDSALVQFYTIERSADGSSFTTVAQTTDEKYIDVNNTSSSTSFYRIVCHQKNGIKLYSKILQTFALSSHENEITLSPNPIGEDRQMKLMFHEVINAGTYNCELWSMSGLKVMSQSVVLKSGQQNLNLQVGKKLAKGAYIFRLINENKLTYHSEVIIR